MRWNIHRQLLIPFTWLQCLTVILVIAITGYVAIMQVRNSQAVHLQKIIETLGSARYPLTHKVLLQLKSLTGAEFVLIDREHNIQQMTLEDVPEIQTALSRQLKLSLESRILELNQDRYLVGFYRSSPGQGDLNVMVLYPQVKWSVTFYQLVTPYLVLALIFGGLTIWISSRIAGGISSRLQKLQAHVGELGELKFSEIPPGEQEDEIRELSQGINKMSLMLDQSFRQNQQQERMRILSQLVGGISHQLRNSLTGVRLALQLHQKSCDSADQETLEKGLEQLRFIEEEIKTLLRVAKGSELIQVPGNLILVISESVQLLRPYCQHQQIEFQTEIKDIATEITDTEGFRGALLNILINATEAAGPQGKVQLLMSTIDEMLEIVIQDNGHGIKPEIEAQIFEPFFTTKPEGAGLGLALARQAIHDNGGELTYARKDGWTVFKIVLNL